MRCFGGEKFWLIDLFGIGLKLGLIHLIFLNILVWDDFTEKRAVEALCLMSCSLAYYVIGVKKYFHDLAWAVPDKRIELGVVRLCGIFGYIWG